MDAKVTDRRNTERGHGVSMAEFEAIFEQCRTWGHWGPDAKRGCLNYITSDKVRAAASLPRQGRAISLQLADQARWSANHGRVADRRRLEQLIETATAKLTEDELAARLVDSDIPWGSPPLARRGSDTPRSRAARPLAKHAARQWPFGDVVPALGEHTRQVLDGLGFGADEMGALASDGVVGVATSPGSAGCDVEGACGP